MHTRTHTIIIMPQTVAYNKSRSSGMWAPSTIIHCSCIIHGQLLLTESPGSGIVSISGIAMQRSHCPPGNHWASYFLKCLVYWPFTRLCSGDNQSVWSSAPVVSRWLWPGNRTCLEVASMVVIWWILAFCAAYMKQAPSFFASLSLLMFCF